MESIRISFFRLNPILSCAWTTFADLVILGGTRGELPRLAVVTNAAMSKGVQDRLSAPVCLCPEAGLLDHMVILLTCYGTARLSPTSSTRQFPCFPCQRLFYVF